MRITKTLIALSCWLAVALQFYISFKISTAPVQTIILLLSYFTILTNLLTAYVFTFRSPDKNPALFGATTVYIFVVGLVYQIFLRHIWSPRGLQALTDELLHSVNPLAVLAFWIFFVKRYRISYNLIPIWLLYPLCYSVYICIRGLYTGVYPYPFIDINALGLIAALRNAAFLMIFFTLLSSLVIFFSRQTKNA